LPVKVFLLFGKRDFRFHSTIRLGVRDSDRSFVDIDYLRIDILVIIFNSINVNTCSRFWPLRIKRGYTTFGSHCEEANITGIKSQILAHALPWDAENNLTLISTPWVDKGAHAKREKSVRVRIWASPSWKCHLRAICFGLATDTLRHSLANLNMVVVRSILAIYVVIHDARETW
jgi:hypothetical protein